MYYFQEMIIYIIHILTLKIFPDAEIYEVHPKTRLRITAAPTRPSTSTTLLSITESSTATPVVDDEFFTTTLEPESETKYYADLLEEEFASEEEVDEVEDDEEEEDDLFYPTVLTTETSTTLDDLVVSTDAVTTEGDVHETADKHAPLEQLRDNAAEDYVFEDVFGERDIVAAEDQVEQLDLEIQHEIHDQVFDESKKVATAWSQAEVVSNNEELEENEDEDLLSNEEVLSTTLSSRLTSYTKNIDTSGALYQEQI